MYKLKISTAEFNFILKSRMLKRKDLAEITGISESYISQIKSGRSISKVFAYAICKAICKDYEIEDLFVKNN